ncbi:Methyl-CpG-binding domain-containing protein 2 [Apostasia shenzhenica]|uniref:Methyl-CpG-binding domain-containing protein 2 n=1 Tax=Apostasia shenzhenica TaxID=1088818 RepID=A0A2I0A797_9ASPA|nr:Methyl-CpG-binding domain-containing protein 2 [Apostasia shenzhenica]
MAMQMQSDTFDESFMVKNKCSASSLSLDGNKNLQNNVEDAENSSEQCSGTSLNQLVVYNPGSISSTEDQLPVSNHVEDQTEPFHYPTPNTSNRVLPSIGAFTVQCASCFKWRLIPTKEKYEQIRESILQIPFVCERGREWRPDISCGDPADISQDGSRLWAIDRPNIAQPPPGWDRQLRIRGEGGTRFADVYYVAPSGKKLRSMVEIQRYLEEHPEFAENGVKLSQFSFQIPRPLQQNYVKKRNPRILNSVDGAARLPDPEEGMQKMKTIRVISHTIALPLSWAAPQVQLEVENGALEFYPTSDISSESSPYTKKRAAKEQIRRPSSKKIFNVKLDDD